MGELFQPTHLLVIAVIAILIFGPRKLPELGKGLGEGLRGFREGIKGNPDAQRQQDAAAASNAATTAASSSQPIQPK